MQVNTGHMLEGFTGYLPVQRVQWAHFLFLLVLREAIFVTPGTNTENCLSHVVLI